MQENKQEIEQTITQNDDLARRRRRVNRLKRLIIGTALVMVFIPVLVCIYLLYDHAKSMQRLLTLDQKIKTLTQQSVDLENQLEETEKTLAELMENGSQDSEEGTSVGLEGESDPFPYDVEQEDGIRKVYLTFDDGPSIYTGEILDILAAYNVKATFFVLGKEDEDSKAMYRRIVNEGHTLAMHSYSHKYSQIYASVDAFEQDFDQIYQLLTDTTGVAPQFYRFPGGSSNKVSKIGMQSMADFLTEKNVVYFDWNISSGDASGGKIPVNRIVADATKNLEKKNTAVILMHDASSKYTTVLALPAIIEKINALENTVILPISDKTLPIQHLKQKLGELDELTESDSAQEDSAEADSSAQEQFGETSDEENQEGNPREIPEETSQETLEENAGES